MRTTAAVSRAPGAALAIEQVELDACRAGEMIVDVRAVGICHTDIVFKDGHVPSPSPMVFGHEGAGVVRSIGRTVSRFAPGDHVVMSFASCGQCEPCTERRPARCVNFISENIGGFRSDGSTTLCDAQGAIHGNFFGQSSFAMQSLVRERDAVKVDRDVPFDILAPLACGIQTGAGTVLNFLRPLPGSVLAVFGAGSVGLAAVMAGKLAGCGTIILIDLLAERLELGRELGATHVVEAGQGDVVDAIRAIAPAGADRIVESTGAGRAMAAALESLAWRGILSPVAIPAPGARVDVPMQSLQNGRVESVTEGDSDPQSFIPRLITEWRSGRFPFDRLITRYRFDQINQAMADSEHGRAIKPVLIIAGEHDAAA